MKLILEKVTLSQKLLYFTFGIVNIAAGLDKFFNFIVYWNQYLHPTIPAFLNIEPQTFLWIVGVWEIILSLLIFVYPVLGGLAASGWLILISIDLISLKLYDIAIRDLGLAVSVYVLVLLTQALQTDHDMPFSKPNFKEIN